MCDYCISQKCEDCRFGDRIVGRGHFCDIINQVVVVVQDRQLGWEGGFGLKPHRDVDPMQDLASSH